MAVSGGARVERVRGLSVLVAAVPYKVAGSARVGIGRATVPVCGENAYFRSGGMDVKIFFIWSLHIPLMEDGDLSIHPDSS